MAEAPKPIPRHVAFMRVLVSLVLLIVGLAILTAPNILFSEKFDETTQKLAAGWIGMVAGYWLA